MIAEVNATARLRWKCRRGVREMDLLLERFLVDNHPHLSPAQKSLFETMLDEADPDIYAWIAGTTEPDNRNYMTIIKQLQAINRE